MSRPARRWRPGEAVEPLAQLLDRGGILAIPTESSYGLGVDPRDPRGVAAVYRVKGREARKPLPVVISDPDQLALLDADLEAAGPACARLARCWPAPLSLLLPLARPLPAAAGAETLAVRVPDLPLLRRLLAQLGRPLTATSANRSGEPPLLTAAAAAELLAGEEAVVIDGGELPGGPPSTLVACRGEAVEVIRPGRFAVDPLVGRRRTGGGPSPQEEP